MREGAADGKFLGSLLENDQRLVAIVALDARNRAQVDDRAAMDLPEELGVELIEELLDRFADQRFSVRGDDLGVLVLGVEVENLIDWNQAHRRPERSPDPFQRTVGSARLELREHGGEIGGRALAAPFVPLAAPDDTGGRYHVAYTFRRPPAHSRPPIPILCPAIE